MMFRNSVRTGFLPHKEVVQGVQQFAVTDPRPAVGPRLRNSSGGKFGEAWYERSAPLMTS
jgi:hypothetical protein